MKYQQELIIKKVDEDEKGSIYLKVYVPKYIEEQINILLNNRAVRFERKYTRKINAVRTYGGGNTSITKRTLNIDTLDISAIVNVLLDIKIKVERAYDEEGQYWFMVVNNKLDYIEQKLMEMDKYFSSLPLIKEYVVVEHPVVKLSDITNIVTNTGYIRGLFGGERV